MNKAEKIIIVVVILLVIGLVAYFGFMKNANKFQAYRTKASVNTPMDCVLISDYKTYEKLISSKSINTELTDLTTLKKSNTTEIFTEEYFETKKIAMVATYEDTSRTYYYSVDNVKYDGTKTIATVYYTDEKGEYAGTLKNSWNNIFFIELPSTVTEVNFIKNEGK